MAGPLPCPTADPGPSAEEAALAALKEEVRGNSYDAAEAVKLVGRLGDLNQVCQALKYMKDNDALTCPVNVVIAQWTASYVAMQTAKLEKGGKLDDTDVRLQSCGAEEKQA